MACELLDTGDDAARQGRHIAQSVEHNVSEKGHESQCYETGRRFAKCVKDI